MAMAGNARALLEAALDGGSEASLAAWSGAGRAGVEVLRDELTGIRPIDTPPGTHQQRLGKPALFYGSVQVLVGLAQFGNTLQIQNYLARVR
jgi:hypothetical protein